MRSLSSWLHTSDRQTRKRAERRPAPGLAAYHRSGPNFMLDKIKDISSTGLYLLTQERWLPGEVVSLTLQKEGPPERNSARRAAVQARAVRWGKRRHRIVIHSARRRQLRPVGKSPQQHGRPARAGRYP